MKLIHTADLHLASKLESRFSREQARMRRNELFDTFRRLADKAESESVRAILISGDIFDEGRIAASVKSRFTDIVRNHPSVDFLCLAGNHDESLAGEIDLPPNLVCFDEEWKRVRYDDVDIYGAELNASNCALLYSTLNTDRTRLNIVMLHGQAIASKVTPDEHTVVLPCLADKNIDYLALGHVHSYRCERLDRRGVWCYSGCLEGRGYDECGDKGYVLIEIEHGEIKSSFIPFACRTIHSAACDVTGLESQIDIENKALRELSEIPSKDLVRLTLTGRVPSGLQLRTESLENALKERFFDADVKKKLKPIIDPEEFRDLLSLRGEFVRLVDADGDLSEEMKDRVLLCGLAALQNEDLSEI